MLRKLVYSSCIILTLYLQFSGFSGCLEEYSYEGEPTNDTLTIQDTTVIPLISFPFCAGCRSIDDFILSKWNFKYDTSLLCGAVTNAVIAPERNRFTFFGPSACSADTGLVMTVFFDSAALDRDKSNVTTDHVIFQYYDNTTFSDIFNSALRSVSFTIDTYVHATGIAKGRFTGYVRTKDNTVGAIMDGKFAIKF